MIKTQSKSAAYQTVFTTRDVQALADAPQEKGGNGAGFGPHELLEAALATCINMAVRMRAAKLGIALESVSTSVHLDRSEPEVANFSYTLQLQGSLTVEQRQQLEQAAHACPVRQTLAKQVQFIAVDAMVPNC